MFLYEGQQIGGVDLEIAIDLRIVWLTPCGGGDLAPATDLVFLPMPTPSILEAPRSLCYQSTLTAPRQQALRQRRRDLVSVRD